MPIVKWFTDLTAGESSGFYRTCFLNRLPTCLTLPELWVDSAAEDAYSSIQQLAVGYARLSGGTFPGLIWNSKNKNYNVNVHYDKIIRVVQIDKGNNIIIIPITLFSEGEIMEAFNKSFPLLCFSLFYCVCIGRCIWSIVIEQLKPAISECVTCSVQMSSLGLTRGSEI